MKHTEQQQSKVPFKPCAVKALPQSLWTEAAATAIRINPANAPAIHQFRAAFPGAVLPPAHLALLTAKYWGSKGVDLTVGFMDNPPLDLQHRILSHMNAWGKFSNVRFRPTNTNPQVRIARQRGDGYWSYLGTDILHIDPQAPTMNLEAFTMNTPDSEFYRVVRHETGHTLGFVHEHMRREIVDDIDQEKAIAYFMKTQGWSREEVIAQVLTPIDPGSVKGTPHADPDSIMCYWLPAEIMKDHTPIPGGTDINPADADFAHLMYPLSVAKP